jgi:hypothetical protein
MKKTIKSKAITVLMICLLVSQSLMAQKVSVKDETIQVDGNALAKIVKIKDKENFGLTSTYEIYALNGDKLIVAAIATDFAENSNNNGSYYYRLSFLTNQQQAIFKLSKLGPEKSLATLIGQSGIIVNNQIDPKMFTEFLAKKSVNPPIAMEYKLVERNHLGTPYIKGKQIYQGLTLIGEFTDISTRPEYDTYEFSTAMGLVVARVNFTGGINAQNFVVTTYKDKATTRIDIPTQGKYSISQQPGVDRNEMALVRIADWLAKNWYL